jgi:hypothetical protein
MTDGDALPTLEARDHPDSLTIRFASDRSAPGCSHSVSRSGQVAMSTKRE